MPSMNLGRQEITYIDTGGEKTVLLILPDNLHSSSAYRGEIEFFSEKFRVLSLDYPGTGKSSREVLYNDERELDLWDNRSDFAMHLLLELGIKSCCVMASGFASLSALYFAGYHAKLHDFEIKGVVADSFLSRMDMLTLHRILDRREHFYVRREKMLREEHGNDWRKVVDSDTLFLRTMANRGGYELPFHVIKSIRCPVLLTGSLCDPVTNGIADDYSRMSSMIGDCFVFLSSGVEHPFMWKDPEAFRLVTELFFVRALR